MGAGKMQSLMSAGGIATSGSLGNNTKIGLGLDVWGAYRSYMSSRSQAEAQADAIIAQGKQAIKTMNYALSNFENERRNAYEASVHQLTAIRLSSRGLEASVENATGEYQSGKTGKLLVRSTKADSLRTTSQVKDNYIRKSDEIDINKERQFINTRDYLRNLQAPRVPTLLGGIFSQAGTLLSSYNAYKNMNTDKMTKVGMGDTLGGTSGQLAEAKGNQWTPNTDFRNASQNPWRVNANDGFSLDNTRNGVLGYTVKDPKAINYGNPNIRFDTDSASYQYTSNGFIGINPSLSIRNFNSNQYHFNGGQL